MEEIITYKDLTKLGNADVVQTLNRQTIPTLTGLLSEAYEQYLSLSVEVEKYCSSTHEVFTIDEDGNKIPKYKKKDLLTSEQFYSVMGKLKRCETLQNLLMGTISMKEVLEKCSDRYDTLEEMKSKLKETTDRLKIIFSEVGVENNDK